MERVKSTFEEAEYSALVKFCERELRSVPDQIRVIVRERLECEGLLGRREEGRDADPK